MNARDKYGATGINAHRQRILAGPGTEVARIKANAERERILAQVTERLSGDGKPKPKITGRHADALIYDDIVRATKVYSVQWLSERVRSSLASQIAAYRFEGDPDAQLDDKPDPMPTRWFMGFDVAVTPDRSAVVMVSAC